MLNRRIPGALYSLAPRALALVGYALLAVGLTWPTARYLTTHVAEADGGRFAYSGLGDTAQFTWSLWWAARALATAHNPFATDLVFYPEGAPLYLHALVFSSGFLLAPITYLFGAVASYNLSTMLGLAGTGYAVFLLAGHFSSRGVAAWFAGALVAACPFLTMKFQVSHLNLLHLGWLALFILGIIRLSETGAWRYVLLSAISFVCNAFTDWYLAIIASFALAFWVGLSIWRAPRRLVLVSRYAMVIVLATIALAPLLVGMWATRDRFERMSEAKWASWQIGVHGYSSDAVGLFFPSLLQPFWRGAAEALTAPLVARVPVAEGWYIAAGWVLLGLAGAGVWRYGRAQWRLLVFAGLFWLLSLGPELRLFGIPTGLPMPYALLQRLPVLETGRRPNLFAIVCILIAAIFAAQGLRWLLGRAGPRRWVALLAGLSLLALLELWPPPRYMVSLAPDPVYALLADQPGPVVDLPVGSDIESNTLRNQMLHGQPIMRGYLSRPPSYPTLRYSPLVRALALVEPLPAQDIVPLGDADLATMQCFYRFRHVVAERRLLQPGQLADLAHLLARLGVPAPWYDDGAYLAYQLPTPSGSCAPFSYLGTGWNDREVSGARVWRWIGQQAELWVVNPAPTPAPIMIELELQAFDPDGQGQPNRLQVVAAGQTLAAFPVMRNVRTYWIALTLPPGPTQLVLRPDRAAPDPTGRLVSLSVTRIGVR
jgi:hypothetical protein